MSKYTEWLHGTYQRAVQSFFANYPASDPELIADTDDFFRSYALHFWSVFSIEEDLFRDSINSIYNEMISSGGEFVSSLQIKIALADRKANRTRFDRPDVLETIIQYDLKHHTNYSRRFAFTAQCVFLTFALLDNELAFEEVQIITKYYRQLTDICDQSHICGYDNPPDPFSFIANGLPVQNFGFTSALSPAHADNNSSTSPILQDLKSLIGLDSVKQEVENITNFILVQAMRQRKGLTTVPMSYHLVFTGNPGTGKTTVARSIAQIYKSLGILPKGQLVETDRSGLVAGYVGQTAIKTREVIDQAIGGVLFIDEAYTLVGHSANDYGQEAIDTLLKAMEDHRHDLVVIVAGYEQLMESFIHSNPGLQSRFNKYIHFDDYTASEMLEIFCKLCRENQYNPTEKAKQLLEEYFSDVSADAIGNARGVRNLFEQIITQQASRLMSSSAIYRSGADVSGLTEQDVESVLQQKRATS